MKFNARFPILRTPWNDFSKGNFKANSSFVRTHSSINCFFYHLCNRFHFIAPSEKSELDALDQREIPAQHRPRFGRIGTSEGDEHLRPSAGVPLPEVRPGADPVGKQGVSAEPPS